MKSKNDVWLKTANFQQLDAIYTALGGWHESTITRDELYDMVRRVPLTDNSHPAYYARVGAMPRPRHGTHDHICYWSVVTAVRMACQ